MTFTFRAAFRKRAGSRLVANSMPSAEAWHAARLLALAYWIDRQVQSGAWQDYREAARRLGVSHARVSQVVGLLMLAPAAQVDVVLGSRRPSERALRESAAAPCWPTARSSQYCPLTRA